MSKHTELLERLRSFGHLAMNDDGVLADWETNPLTAAAADAIEALLEQIAKQQKAGDALAAVIQHQPDCSSRCLCLPGHHLLVWEHIRKTWNIDHG